MSGVLKVIGMIAGAVAVVASAGAALGIVLGGTMTFMGIASTTIALVAGAVAGVASLGMYILSKPPPARGSVAQLVINPDAPSPYAMGEGYVAGVLRKDVGYGPTLKKVPNPYRWMVSALSVAGPVASVTPWVDLEPIGSYYTGFLYTDTQLGEQPESSALAPFWSGAPGWDSSSKLSGVAAIGWNLKFDKDGKVFAGGVPRIGGYGQWVRVYDPRLDSTFPGGSGSHRIDDEATWEWSENPALHALAYAYGRYSNGTRIFGVGLGADAIDIATVAAWANVCEANGWTIFGVVWEPGNRWENLKDICAAGGAVPAFAGGVLGFKYSAPGVALDTITEADLTDDPVSVTAMASWRERINTVVPKYLSPDHEWQLVDAEPVSVASLVTEDGEIKQASWPFNLVKNVDQAAQLARYRIEDSRELGTIEITCKPRLRAYRPGEMLELDLPEKGLTTKAVILTREFDAAKMTVKFTLIGETDAKHTFALGQTGTPPPTPALGQTAEERDAIAAAAIAPPGLDETLIAQSYPTDADPSDGLIQATDTAITVESHTRTYSDKTVSVTGDTLTVEDDGTTAIVATTLYHIYYDDADRAGGAVSLKATQDSTVAANSPANPARHYLGSITTDTTGGTGTSYGGSIPPGWTYDNWNNL